MKKIGFLFVLLFVFNACKESNQIESEISKIDIDLNVERFDLDFANAETEDLPELKHTYPFLFSERIPDSVWVERINDSLQQELSSEVEKAYSNFDDIQHDIESLFQHLKYYDKTFKVPRVITVTSDVDYRNKTIVTDTIVLISLDTYLGSEHRFYEGIQRFISLNMKRSQIVSDLAASYSEGYIYQTKPKTLLDDMIYYGKQLYFKDQMIPFKSDAEKIGYSEEQLEWAIVNESEIWRYFIERELLFSTDNSLAGRFIADAPFSKFYLELDSESPGRIGQYLGWQIVRSFMKNNEVPFMEMLQMDADEIFNNSKFKPRK
ncbi:gliding motility lipoprotein GldB [Gelidibacter maritimus]|uniref:Gliding motility lipoprotein GldB n=1 Tax=Gelidibacter maritimus TaxID=2761487 RepID=A0A7W2M7I5_9FLAO|nr:gliding motility lipoprotein GldB [Gelidibacter maritimus]MBA6154098.1 gliding motility lipoprotein GldB [Gelidibacter maritimus]